MPVTQPISGAKVGDVGSIGSPQVINQRQGVFPTGRASTLAFGMQASVYDPAARPEVQLILADARTPSTNFDFGGGQFLYQHAYRTDAVFGTSSVANAAKDIRPTGFDHSGVAATTVAHTTIYDKWVLNLVDAVPIPNRFHFYWGTTQNLYAHGKTTSNQFGDLTSEQPQPIWGAGFPTYSGVAPRVSQVKVLHVAKYNEFNLDLVDARVHGTNLPFGTPFTMRPLGWSSQSFGTQSATNVAKDIRPSGWVSQFVQPPVCSPLRGGGDKNFYFDQGRLPANATNIGFYFAGGKQIDGSGWLSQEFGAPLVYLHLQPVVVPGIPTAAAFGTAFLDHFALKIRPDGWVETGFGTPVLPAVVKTYGWNSNIFQNFTKVDNWFKYLAIYPFTGQPPTPQSPTVYNLLQFVRPNGKAHSNGFGTAHLTNWQQFISCTGWVAPKYFGTQWVTYHTRSVGPAYLSGTQTSFGTPFIAWRNRTISPAGLAAGAFGAPLVKEKAQRCYPVGRASLAAFGVPLVRDRAQRCYPFALDSNLYGTGFVYLWKQEVKPAGILQWEFEKDRFGYYTNVYTKNKKITTNGYVDSRFSMAGLVYNGARRVSVWGTIPMTRYGTAFVAPRIRSFGVAWYTQEVFGTPYVRTRQVLNLDGWGWHSMKFGIPSRVWSNMQFIKPFATYEQTNYGRQWVSYGLRDLRPSSILTQPAGSPFVSYNPRYIKPAGIQYGYMGTLHLETHYNLIKLWGYLNDGYGTPSIRNNTPEVHVYGAFAFLPGGSPNVSLMRRYLRNPATQDTGVVGTPFVSYRTRKIRPPSPDYLRWGNGLVQFDQSQLAPPQQKIIPDSIQGGAGVLPTWEWEHPDAPYSGQTIPLGYPTVKLNTIFAPSLGQVDKFGTPLTRSMVIFVDPGPASFAFGTVKLFGGTKWIKQSATPLDDAFGNTNVVGSQIIHCGQTWDAGTSTWYDWSFHTSQEPYDPWFYWRAQTAGPVFGSGTNVTLQHRRIYPMSYYWDVQGFAEYGTPRVSTRPQYIRPAGVNSYKRGLPDVSHEGMKPIYAFPWADDMFGSTAVQVQDYGPKWLRPAGLPSPGMGVGRIELKHRRVYPTGIYQFTSPKGAQYIGPYLRIYAKPALDHSSFGTLYTDYKHRKVYQADVTDDMEPWQTSTATKVKHQARGYFIDGTDFGVQFGLADVGNRVKHVGPAGWEEFETGFSYVPTSYPGLSKLKAQAFVMRPYTSTMEFGNGTVAHG